MDDDMNLDFNSTDLPKLSETSNLKKYAIIGGTITAFIIILIIIIILITYSGNGGKREKIGEIVCKYERAGTEIQILGENFKNQDNFEIIIKGTKTKFIRYYTFKNDEETKIQFDIYGPINMDYMFKDISALKSIVLFSEKDAKISSMANTFENCENLESFINTGFDILKSNL